MDWMLQLEYLLRLLSAAVLGAIIGVEREKRGKEAGIRTHLIVGLASCLMMLVSKYGFFDVISHGNIDLDPSRIAAGIVTGVGFLGAGVIFTRGRGVNGLTTAAGVWATVGVGMAMGAGMYLVGAAAAVCIVGLQAVLHADFPLLRHHTELVKVRLNDQEGAMDRLMEAMAATGLELAALRAERREDGGLWVLLELHGADEQTLRAQCAALMAKEYVQAVEW